VTPLCSGLTGHRFRSRDCLLQELRGLLRSVAHETAPMSKPDGKCGEEPTGIPRVDALREARRDLRFRLYVEVMIHSPSRGSLSGKTLEISERGFSATLPFELRCGEIVELNLKLRIGPVNVRAVVRDRNAFRHGFQFVEPNPALHLIRENCCLLERIRKSRNPLADARRRNAAGAATSQELFEATESMYENFLEKLARIQALYATHGNSSLL